MNKRYLKIGIAALALASGGLAATALAARTLPGMAEGFGGPGHGEFMKHHVAALIDDALDAAKVPAAERDRVAASRDKAFEAIHGARPDRRAEFAEAAALFEADKLDGKQVAAFRARHEATAERVADAVVQSVTEAHDALKPSERVAVADYLKNHMPGQHGKRLKGEMMKRFASAKLDELLDGAQVSEAQRTQIYAARDQVFTAMAELHESGGPLHAADKALGLFVADRIDPAAVKALRDEQRASMKKAGDVMVQAIYDLHDALTPAQRKSIVEQVRAHHARFEQGHHGPHAPHAPHAE